MAEKKEKEYDVKAFAVANLNAQKTNMHIELFSTSNKDAAIGAQTLIPALTIRNSPFNHTSDMEAIGLKCRWDGSAVRGKDHHEKLNEGFTLMPDGLTMVIVGEESLKALADAGVEFPAADQFMSRARKATRSSVTTIV